VLVNQSNYRKSAVGKPLRGNMCRNWEFAMFLKSIVCFATLAVAVAAGECSQAQTALSNAPSSKTSELYPLTVGSKWHYRMTVEDETVSCVTAIDKMEKIDGQDAFRLEVTIEGVVTGSEHLASNEKGVFRVRMNDESIQPFTVIKLPLKVGENWKETIQTEDGVLTTTTTVLAEEEVTVPAGKFRAIPLRIDMEDPEIGTITSTIWFAANVGIVQQTTDVGGMQIVMALEKYEIVR
jgi:hypothetical protein